MKVIAIIGTSALGKTPFVEPLIEALRLDGHTVSCIKHAPDGFDLDQPGKASFARRSAGAREVMLVGDQRLVLMNEYGRGGMPGLDELLRRLAPVDIALVEGFHDAPFPTVEVYRPASGRTPRYPRNPAVVAVVSDEILELPLRCFRLDDAGGLSDFLVATVLERVEA